MTLAPENIKGDIILASNSPRRRELLQMIVPRYTIAVSKNVEENIPEEMLATPEEVPQYLALIKAAPYIDDLQPEEILITADTVVINHGSILGKPHDSDEAVEMLRSLSGHTHKVVTGVVLTSRYKQKAFSTVTDVEFSEMSDDEIRQYVERFQPMDKAGAYGIQEWIGCVGINGIHGDFYNVMGLPLHDLYHALKTF